MLLHKVKESVQRMLSLSSSYYYLQMYYMLIYFYRKFYTFEMYVIYLVINEIVNP